MGIKYEVNSEFFDSWSPEMAYFLGYLYADGSLEDSPAIRGKYVRATSTDLTLLESLKRCLKSAHTIRSMPRKTPKEKPAYLLRIGNAALYASLAAHGLTPNKSLTMTLPEVPKKYFGDFVRGYFDGDGCVFLEKAAGQTQEKIIKRLRIIFTSGSKIFLEVLQRRLSEYHAQLSTGRLFKGGRAYRLVYPTSGSIVLFELMYSDVRHGLFLDRKYAIFHSYFLHRPGRLPIGMKLRENMAQW